MKKSKNVSFANARLVTTALVLLLLMIFQLTTDGADITAVSGSRNDIQAAVDLALDGDNVIIPTGNWTFSGIVTFPEGINIKGAGRDNTILTKSDQNSDPMFKVITSSGKPFKISGITFQGLGYQLLKDNSSSTILDTGLEIYGKATNFVIENCRFKGFAGHGIKIDVSPTWSLQGHPVGVIANNEFIDIYYSTSYTSRGYGVALYGDNSWPELQLGSNNAIFIEDNYFTHNRHCVAGNMGGRFVFRHNTIVDNYYPFAAIDTHGKKVGEHGARSYEIYDNTVTGGIEWNGTAHATWALGLRGGDGVVFNNTFTGMYRAVFITIEDFYNMSSPTYPLDDQITDMWLWNNTLDGNTMSTLSLGWTTPMALDLAPYLQEDRDYHFAQKTNYAAYPYPHPLLSMAGYWKFDETTGTIAVDSSASGNNAVLYGPSTATGEYGNALDFNGTSDYVDCTDTPNLKITGELTISAWINPDSGTNATTEPQRPIAARYKWQSGGTGQGWFFGSGWKNNGLSFTIYNGSGTHGSVTYSDFFTASEGLNVWKHVVGVFKPGEYVKLYIDGKCVATDNTDIPTSIPYLSATPMMIGRRSDGNYFFDGKIDEVKIYAKALDESEINLLYNQIADGSFENGLGTDLCWQVRTGSPVEDTAEVYDGSTAIRFDKPSSDEATESTIKLSSYIPVNADQDYKLSAWAKGNSIVTGTTGWHKFIAVGRWYDKNMVEIGIADLNFDIGTYDWTEFSVIRHSPTTAAYYRTTAIGILRSGTGTAWIDKMSIYPLNP